MRVVQARKRSLSYPSVRQKGPGYSAKSKTPPAKTARPFKIPFPTIKSIVRPSSFFPLLHSRFLLAPQQRALAEFFARLDRFRVVCSSKAHASTAPAVRSGLRALDVSNGTNPLPHSSNVSTAALANHRSYIRIAFHFLLHLLPQLLSPRRTEFVSQDVVSQLSYADVVLLVYLRLSSMISRLRGQLFQC